MMGGVTRGARGTYPAGVACAVRLLWQSMHSAWRGVPGARSGNGHVPEFGFSDASCTDGVTKTGCLNCLPNSACRFRLVTDPSWHCKQVFSSTILSRRCPTCGACGLWQLSHPFAATPVY